MKAISPQRTELQRTRHEILSRSSGKYSNYLSPQLGLLSADTWVIGTSWLRNTMLNQLIRYLSHAAVLLVPLVIGNVARVLEPKAHSSEYSSFAIGAIILALIFWTVNRISSSLRPIVDREFNAQSKPVSPDDDSSAWRTLIGPLWLTSVLLSFLIIAGEFNPLDPLTGFITYVALLFLFGMAVYHGGFWRCYQERNQNRQLWRVERALLAGIIVLVCSAVTFTLLAVDQGRLCYLQHTQISLSAIVPGAGSTHIDIWQCIGWGPFLITLALAVGVALQVVMRPGLILENLSSVFVSLLREMLFSQIQELSLRYWRQACTFG